MLFLLLFGHFHFGCVTEFSLEVFQVPQIPESLLKTKATKQHMEVTNQLNATTVKLTVPILFVLSLSQHHSVFLN
jgi:hypothetical protein